nr:hypothetical protein GCM10020241_58070 [Streptoalloteichus tenebrarius]
MTEPNDTTTSVTPASSTFFTWVSSSPTEAWSISPCNTMTPRAPSTRDVADAPAPLAAAPVVPAPVIPEPFDPAPFDPAPFDPAPFDPAPVNPAPFDAVPFNAEPLNPAPFDRAPFEAEPFDPAPLSPVPFDSMRSSVAIRSLPGHVRPRPAWDAAAPVPGSPTLSARTRVPAKPDGRNESYVSLPAGLPRPPAGHLLGQKSGRAIG